MSNNVMFMRDGEEVYGVLEEIFTTANKELTIAVVRLENGDLYKVKADELVCVDDIKKETLIDYETFRLEFTKIMMELIADDNVLITPEGVNVMINVFKELEKRLYPEESNV